MKVAGNPTFLTLREFKESKTVAGRKWFTVSGAWIGYASNKPFKTMSPNLRPPDLGQCRTCSWCSVIAADLTWINITSHFFVSAFIWKMKLIISRWQSCCIIIHAHSICVTASVAWHQHYEEIADMSWEWTGIWDSASIQSNKTDVTPVTLYFLLATLKRAGSVRLLVSCLLNMLEALGSISTLQKSGPCETSL